MEQFHTVSPVLTDLNAHTTYLYHIYIAVSISHIDKGRIRVKQTNVTWIILKHSYVRVFPFQEIVIKYSFNRW
jgi:hypothetical protein